MGKFLVLSLTDHEEYILSRIMEIIAVEPGFDHIVTSHLCNTLVFPGLELRLKERTAYRNGELISILVGNLKHWYTWQNIHPGYFLPDRSMKKYGEDGENCGTAVAFVPKINSNPVYNGG